MDGNDPKDILAEIRLRISGSNIFVGDAAVCDERAISVAFTSLKRRTKKVKEKRKDHKFPVKKMTDNVYNVFLKSLKSM